MVALLGARQVGKTTLAEQVGGERGGADAFFQGTQRGAELETLRLISFFKELNAINRIENTQGVVKARSREMVALFHPRPEGSPPIRE